MTFNIGHVQGGTNAGWKREKLNNNKPWVCGCGTEQPAYILNCTECDHQQHPPED